MWGIHAKRARKVLSKVSCAEMVSKALVIRRAQYMSAVDNDIIIISVTPVDTV